MDFETLAGRWIGSKADTYDADKQRQLPVKSRNEDRAVAQILQKIGPGKRVLDVPVGTGRFIELYQGLEQDLTGIDMSDDMLKQARSRLEALEYQATLRKGDIRNIPYPESHFDLVVCMRFLSWIDDRGVASVMRELTRVSDKHLVIGIRRFLPASELDPLTLSGLRECAGQVNKRIAQRLKPNRRHIVHSLGAIRRIFDSNRLRVVTSTTVERRHKDGTEAVVYWLSKAEMGRRRP